MCSRLILWWSPNSKLSLESYLVEASADMDEEFSPSSVFTGDYESIIDSQAPTRQVIHSRNSDIQSFA